MVDLLVAVGLPNHHGLGLGGGRRGDGRDLGDNGADGGESGHFDRVGSVWVRERVICGCCFGRCLNVVFRG